jgi:hypothetical protein
LESVAVDLSLELQGTPSRAKMVALARSKTRRMIRDEQLSKEMIAAMDILAGCFSPQSRAV